MRTDEIINCVFTRSFMGYDVEEVDRFLDEIIACFDRYEAEKKEMLTALEYLLGKLERGEPLPIAETKRALAAANRAAGLHETPNRPASEETESIASKSTESIEESELAPKTARAIQKAGVRPSGNGAEKPKKRAEASRVKRVGGTREEPFEPVAVELESGEAAPTDDWLDEMMDEMNLAAKARELGVEPVNDEAARHASAPEAEPKPQDEKNRPAQDSDA